ncbi:hypothetical protein BDP27DRAFT_1338753 [Rhodocollybia butyracea]|uniref:Uncharacterized protein n=1 Tax=Rhodocollybia butyracea TaxID=206335 RepID=A0A9P5PE49_9AGAR|nr:hypothetical protein BDP27DRAFT_1338753 [Rhodocollybia butyracea]
MSLFKITTSGAVSVSDCPILNTIEDQVYWSGNTLAILKRGTTGRIQAVDLSSETVHSIHYAFTPVNNNLLTSSFFPIFLPEGYVLLWFVSYDQPSDCDHHFELYRVSGHTVGTPLLPTHRGHFLCGVVSDPLRLVTSHIALNDRLELTGHIWLIMNQPDGPRLVQIKLQTDGSLTFVVGSPRLKFLADMQFTVHPCGKTQGITMEQSADLLKKPHLELHHVSANSEQLQVRIGARLGVNDAGRHESDVFQGFLVTVGKKIDIVDLVP